MITNKTKLKPNEQYTAVIIKCIYFERFSRGRSNPRAYILKEVALFPELA